MTADMMWALGARDAAIFCAGAFVMFVALEVTAWWCARRDVRRARKDRSR